ncbi:hypothetical protein [Aliikangiella coralliicola]|uniref:Uncharacterized protein n=1 Tax=Aliikangiella coralliicola TaxID=2592383 RepID=A0A545U8T3_9GAMM|nr:hypothetical protein [Aliikangiella coralliicola]TQV85881.1 hypothetical protein FLL46_18330 [Aliikangiella coralliicola]
MSNVYTYLKDAFLVLAPLLLIELFLRSVYQIGQLKLAIWWFKNYDTVDYLGVLVIAFFFTYFSFFATFGHIFQAASLAFHGETHTLIYIGEKSKNKGLYVSPDNLKSPPIEYSDSSDSYNYSFSTLFTKTQFKRDKGTDRLGSTVESFSAMSLLSSFLVGLAMLLPLVGVLHTLAYPIVIELGVSGFNSSLSTLDAFQAMLKPWGLSIGKLVAINIAIFILVMIVVKLPGRSIGKQVFDLPSSIRTGETISGIPVEIEREINISRNLNGGTEETDTGFRTIVFQFTQDFPQPVYVSVYYDSRQFPGLEDRAYEHIKSQSPLQLKIMEDLKIEVID